MDCKFITFYVEIGSPHFSVHEMHWWILLPNRPKQPR